jgi:hypothetical protein
MTANEIFKTWTFDHACKEMGQNVLHRAIIRVTSDLDAIDDSDLIIFGVFGDENTASNTVPQPILTGQAKKWDEVCNGSISELMIECFDSLKHGATLGSASPLLRVVSTGSKVSLLFNFTTSDIQKTAEILTGHDCTHYQGKENRYCWTRNGRESVERNSLWKNRFRDRFKM